MNKTLTAAIAALTIGGVVASAIPAQAQTYRDGRYDRRHRDDNGKAIAAGVIGLALGAALGSSSRNNNTRYYDNRGTYGYNQPYGQSYNQPYGQSYNQPYGQSYGYGNSYGYAQPYAYAQPRYRVCTTRERVYDPYSGRRITVRREYAC